jgi:DNA-binding response OmpR family regulator
MHTSEHSRQADHAGCVLVVDDNDDLRRMLCVALKTAGFAVIEAGTQLDVPRHLAGARPDAVVIDLQRSEADGLAVLADMRDSQTLGDVPILFLSGSDDDKFRLRVITAGADWVGVRPLCLLELQTRVAELVRQGRPAAQQVRPTLQPAVSQLKLTG